MSRDTAAKSEARFNPFTTPRLRLASGMIVGLFVTMHLINHGLGLISIELANQVRHAYMPYWQNPVSSVILYGAFVVHIALGLRRLYRRRHLRMPFWEAAQICLGVAVPMLLLTHIAETRITWMIQAFDISYEYGVAKLWLTAAYKPWTQSLLVLVVWGHFLFGLHYFLRLRGWYPAWRPLLFVSAVLVPTFAILGFARLGRQVAERAAESPEWLDRILTRGIPDRPDVAYALANADWIGPAAFGLIVAAILIARGIRRAVMVSFGGVAVTYPGGNRATAEKGMTILEVSRGAGIAHASFCGGRGRCTTCRVRVIDGLRALPHPNAVEREALARIGNPPNVRLACQTRPTEKCEVAPLIPVDDGGNPREKRPGGVSGQELEVAVLFIDLRGSTTLAEGKLPFDVVFILNQFFSEMSAAIEESGGHYSNFTGDGLMALFGMESNVERGVRDAMNCAFRMLSRLKSLNIRMEHELNAPLVMGIGIHSGEAIVGEMGPPKTPILTALGDTINTTARLESLTKDFAVPLIISAEAAHRGGVDLTGFPMHEAPVKGRAEPVKLYTVPVPDSVA